MSDAENQFLLEGLARYAQAVDTIGLFKTSLFDRLQSILREFSSKAYTAGSAMRTGSGADSAGKWVWAMQEGTLVLQSQKNVKLELGVWWNGGEVAYYADFLDEDDKPISFAYRRSHPRIEFKKWSKSPRLFISVTRDQYAAMNEDLLLLLEELCASFE